MNRGSMMPFMMTGTVDGDELRSLPSTFIQSTGGDHPTVKGWVIEADGSVRFPHAALVASKLPVGQEVVTSFALPRELAGFLAIMDNHPEQPENSLGLIKADGDLMEWVSVLAG